jgi:hypothetical protein
MRHSVYIGCYARDAFRNACLHLKLPVIKFHEHPVSVSLVLTCGEGDGESMVAKLTSISLQRSAGMRQRKSEDSKLEYAYYTTPLFVAD